MSRVVVHLIATTTNARLILSHFAIFGYHVNLLSFNL